MEYEFSHKRAFAQLVDILLITAPISFLIYAVNGTSSNAETMASVISVAIFLTYMTITEGLCGQSLGKKLFKIKVLMEDGGKCSIKAALIRNIFRIIDALPNLYIVGILVIVFTKKRQRIGDLAAKTVVVRLG